ncbi:MAG: peptidoglycan DD-metalloendopeptidase family protein, partial [Oscillospiraceae bacterium]|nr:peptidoglycan DD-metalloendopeptidase family protein [Oscillospiraceae bacterium]
LYRTRIRSMEETGTISYWSILFQANSFSDLLDRLDMIHEIAESDQLMLEKLAEATEQVKSEREELEAQRVELEQTEQQLADEQTAMEEKRAESDKLILQMASEAAILSGEFEIAEAMEEEIRAQIKKTETEYYNALSREEAARIAEMNKKNNNKVSGNGKGATSTGGFFFPLAWSNGVTSAYGQRVHPIYGYNGFHYGVDLGAGMNTAIYATKSGTVTASTYGEANGYYVTVNHGDGYSSLYAHMVSNEVSVGDYVKQGDLIGHVGTSGWSNGPHLHFEILYNGSNVNPMNYISVP